MLYELENKDNQIVYEFNSVFDDQTKLGQFVDAIDGDNTISYTAQDDFYPSSAQADWKTQSNSNIRSFKVLAIGIKKQGRFRNNFMCVGMAHQLKNYNG